MLKEAKKTKYPVLDDIEVPEKEIENWQVTIDMLAKIANIPVALIMRVHAEDIEVFVSSHSPGNVYHRGEKAPLDTGLYCETVMSTRRKLLVPNALKNPLWNKNPDIKLGMISYSGLPLTWPEGQLFGTICILDKQENNYSPSSHDLLERFRDSVQFSLHLIYDASAERIRAEKEMKLNKQLITLNAEKDKLFSIIAHDLRNPFHSFLSLTKMLAEDSKSFSAEELSEIGSNMNQSANNLFTLLQNLFEWAGLQKGTMNFQPEELSLSELISVNVKLVSQRCKQKGIRLINMATNVKVHADKKMINSVLSNLLWNAVKFTNSNGAVAINAKINDYEMIEISVKDTGVGINKKGMDNLFKIGEKTGREGTDGELSTGLGLLLCKDFAEKNGGEIWVESEEGVGSTFYFTLRAHE